MLAPPTNMRDGANSEKFASVALWIVCAVEGFGTGVVGDASRSSLATTGTVSGLN